MKQAQATGPTGPSSAPQVIPTVKATSVAPAQVRQGAGTTTLTVTGEALTAVTAASVRWADGSSIGAALATPHTDTTLTLLVTVSHGVAQGGVSVVLTAGSEVLLPNAFLVSPITASPNGSDSAAGTALAPFRTATHALAVAQSGDTVELRAGTYEAGETWPLSVTATSQPREVDQYNVAAGVTLRGVGAVELIGPATGASNRSNGLTINGTQVFIENLDLHGFQHGIFVAGGNATLTDVSSHHNDGDGMYVGVTAASVVNLRSSTSTYLNFTHNGYTSTMPGCSGATPFAQARGCAASAVTAFGDVTLTLEDLDAGDNAARGFQILSGAHGVVRDSAVYGLPANLAALPAAFSIVTSGEVLLERVAVHDNGWRGVGVAGQAGSDIALRVVDSSFVNMGSTAIEVVGQVGHATAVEVRGSTFTNIGTINPVDTCTGSAIWVTWKGVRLDLGSALAAGGNTFNVKTSADIVDLGKTCVAVMLTGDTEHVRGSERSNVYNLGTAEPLSGACGTYIPGSYPNPTYLRPCWFIEDWGAPPPPADRDNLIDILAP